MNSRLFKIKDDLKRQKVDVALVSSIPNITYLTGYSGFSKEEREVMILIVKKGQYILTDKRYLAEIKRYIKDFELEEVSSSTPFRIALEKLIKKHKIKKLGVEEDNLTISEYKSLSKHFNNIYHLSVDPLRTVKDKHEIKAIEKACQLTDKTFDYILTKIKRGITEKELAFEIEFFIKKNGSDLAFEPIVAFGKHSSVPHHKPQSVIPARRFQEASPLGGKAGIQGTWIPNQVGNDKGIDNKLNQNNIILLDFGAKVDNYCSDMTRVVFLGKATNEQKRVYETVLEAQQKAMEFINNFYSSSEQSQVPSGTWQRESRSLNSSRSASWRTSNNSILASEVDKVAHEYIRSKGYGDNIFHSLGHGVGLEIHEAPRLSPKSKETLKPGMVFTVEPGIYLPDKFGVRIEDTAVLEKNGLRLLTRSPKTLLEL